MKKNKVRIQQVLMIIASILFLVWVGFYGMKDEKVAGGIVEKEEIKKVATENKSEIAENTESVVEEGQDKLEESTMMVMKLSTKYHTYSKEYDAKIKILDSKVEKTEKSSRIVAVFVKDGQMVNAGQPIIGLEVENKTAFSDSELKKELRKFESLKSKLESAAGKLQKSEHKDSIAHAKQQGKYNEILKEYQLLEEKINAGQNKFARIVVKSTNGGVVKNLTAKVGDDVASNSSLFKVISYDVYFDLNAIDLEQWRLSADKAIVKGSFVGKSGQSIPFDIQVNSLQERVHLKQYIPIWENLKFFTDDSIDNKVSLVAVYKDIIEVSNNAVGIDAEGRSFVWIVNADKRITKKVVTPIKKYGSYVLLLDNSLNGLTILSAIKPGLKEGKEINI